MPSDPASTSYRYQQALSPLVRDVEDHRLKKRLSEVLALLDFNSTLNRSLELKEILDLVLCVAMGETRASWAAILLRDPQDVLRAAARHGRTSKRWTLLEIEAGRELPQTATRESAEPGSLAARIIDATEASLVVPLVKSDRLVGVRLLSKGPTPVGEDERMFAEALCVSAAASIDNGRVYEELQRLNRRLSLKVYQLNSLFDIARELNASLDVAKVREVLVASAMGQILTTRGALVQDGKLVAARGFKLTAEEAQALGRQARRLDALTDDVTLGDLEDEDLKKLLEQLGMGTLVPLRMGEQTHGVLLLGTKISGNPAAREDRDFLRALASQGAAALDNLRLTVEWLDKQKIEEEMALAREIQRGLLPDRDPELSGWEIAGINTPCLTVGGDYYDYLERPDGRLWLVIADVSGKGTGAALLMASIQSGLHALSGLAGIDLVDLARRLNEIVYRSTGAAKYVTAFLGSLDPASGELVFVNAGHCYPLLLRSDRTLEQLQEGSTAIGMLPQIEPELGRTKLEPGDLLVMYTDGLSETRNPEGDEFEEARIVEIMREHRDKKARDLLGRLVAGVRVFAAGQGLADDLTLVVAKRSEAALSGE